MNSFSIIKLPSCILWHSTRVEKVKFYPATYPQLQPLHEIAFNPFFMSRADDLTACRNLVVQMVHLWQYEFGNPSEDGEWNQEFKDKMEETGLIPVAISLNLLQDDNDKPLNEEDAVVEYQCVCGESVWGDNHQLAVRCTVCNTSFKLVMKY